MATGRPAADGPDRTRMRPIHLSACCAVIAAVLLALGERTLPLFGGDEALAQRVYQTGFMLLITGMVAGVIPGMYARIARFARKQQEQDDAYPRLSRTIIPLFETAGPWLAVMVGVAGVVLAVYVWFFEAPT